MELIHYENFNNLNIFLNKLLFKNKQIWKKFPEVLVNLIASYLPELLVFEENNLESYKKIAFDCRNKGFYCLAKEYNINNIYFNGLHFNGNINPDYSGIYFIKDSYGIIRVFSPIEKELYDFFSYTKIPNIIRDYSVKKIFVRKKSVKHSKCFNFLNSPSYSYTIHIYHKNQYFLLNAEVNIKNINFLHEYNIEMLIDLLKSSEDKRYIQYLDE